MFINVGSVGFSNFGLGALFLKFGLGALSLELWFGSFALKRYLDLGFGGGHAVVLTKAAQP